MTSVESRIVSMKFDNKDFQARVSETLTALGKLKQAFSMSGASKGLAEVNSEASKFSLSGMVQETAKVSKSFLALTTIALTALANITNRAINAGISIAKALTIDTKKQGFEEYELKLGSIQTIMAGSGASLEKVNRKLNELNTYADKTIYSFADMTQNIGKFTNAGVSLNTSVAAIQGVANVAAVSGANANEASRAMYNFAQALSKGYVQLIDWKSIELANMGTVEFKQQLIDAAAAQGTLTKQGKAWVTEAGKTVTATQGFNDSLTDQWLTTEVLTKTLGDYADETTDIGKKAFAAAQDVKTFTQLVDTVKEAIGSGWASSFEIMIGNFDEAKELFTGINNVVSDFVGKQAEARNALLQTWKDNGGRTAVIEGLAAAFKALGKIMKVVRAAFRDVFPKVTGEQLAELSKRFKDFMLTIQPAQSTLTNLRRTLRGVFSVFKIGWEVVKGLAGVFKTLFGVIFSGSGSFLNFTGNVGDMLTNFSKTLSAGKAIPNIFEKISNAVKSAAGGFDKLVDVLKRVFGIAKDIASSAFAGLSDIFSNMFANFDINTVIKGIGAGGIAGIGLALRKLVKEGIGINFGGKGGGFLDGISNALKGLTGVLEGMQQSLKANALLKIAGAIALLTASIILLAGIDSDALKKSITAISISFGLLLGAMKVLTLIADPKSIGKLGTVSASLIALSAAVLILSAAVKNLSSLSWSELAKGLAGVAGALLLLVGASYALSKASGGLVRTGVGLIGIALGLRILAGAIKQMSKLSWIEMARGLTTLGGALVIIAGAVRLMPNMLRTAASLVVLGAALNIIAFAVKQFSKGDLLESGKGLLVMAGALIVIAGAMRLMPKNMLVTSVALVAVSVALNLVAAAVLSLSGMSWEEIAKGLVALGGALIILAGGLFLMEKATGGILAMIAASVAVGLLVPALVALGALEWSEIAKALITLAGAFVVIGLAGLLITPILPAVLGLGVALLLLGAGLAAAGVGAIAFAKAFEIGIRAAGKGGEVLRAMLKTIIKSIPDAMRAFGKGVVEFIKIIGRSHREFVKAFTSILTALLDAIIKVIPKLGKAFDKMMKEGVRIIRKWFPELVSLGLDMIYELLKGINRNIDRIRDKAADIVVKFIKSLGRNVPKIIDAGTDFIIRLVQGITRNFDRVVDAGGKAVVSFVRSLKNGINKYAPQIRAEARGLAFALADGLTGGLASRIGSVVSRAREMASRAVGAIKSLLRISSPSKVFEEIGQFSAEGLAHGLYKYTRTVENASENMGTSVVTTLGDSLKHISDLAVGELTMDPIITPVLDLSKIKKEATTIDHMLGVAKVRADVTYSRAATVSSERQAVMAQNAQALSEQTANVEYVQNNYSPKALSAIDIYRNTRNQLALVKEALAL